MTGMNGGMTLKPFEPNKSVTSFVSMYQLFEDNEIQQIQLQHRLDLVNAFGIEKGMNVLEIGCGQGDTTVALADAVGEDGKVIGIDIASRHYGAPLTLGQATDLIKKSTLGKRITFLFNEDFATFTPNEVFDVAVLSHSSWYFRRPEDLHHYFQKLRQMTNRVCFAEWDIDFTSLNQRVHFCAASILALYASFIQHDGNIQNLFHKKQIQNLLEEAGFQIEKQGSVNAAYLQDVQWEKNEANRIRKAFDAAPAMIQSMVNGYYELMNTLADNEESLNSFIICAR